MTNQQPTSPTVPEPELPVNESTEDSETAWDQRSCWTCHKAFQKPERGGAHISVHLCPECRTEQHNAHAALRAYWKRDIAIARLEREQALQSALIRSDRLNQAA